MSFLKCASLAVLALATQVPQAIAAPVLVISIDGLRADDLTMARQHGLNIPTLRALQDSGIHADGVRGVLPTITYPSHTTMITGVYPARHGIVSNVAFDPEGKNQGGWMWYAQDIKVPTLWDTVKAAGGKVASIGWPSSVGARSIDYNIPEFWRAKVPEDEKLLRVVSTPGMPEEIERVTGVPFAMVALDPNDVHEGMDGARMAWVAAIVARYRPQLVTLHLVSLDGVRHKFGPYSPEAKATLEHIDRELAPMIEKARAAEPDLVVAVVSDHGFSQITKGLNLLGAFAAEGLVTLGTNGKVVDWRAYPWVMGGSAAIVLKDTRDKVSEERAGQLLAKLAADPANGIDKVLTQKEVAQLGGSPQGAFWVSMKSGFSVVGNADKALLQDVSGRGSHGYSPQDDEMLSAFLLSGPGIARQHLGIIDMRDIGPTLGVVLGAPLPAPDGKAIPIKPGK